VIVARTGASSFEQALRTLVLHPLGMTRTRPAASFAWAQAPDEARYHLRVYDPNNGWRLNPLEIGQSARSPTLSMVAGQYGGWDAEIFEGSGGLSSAVIDVARLAAMFSDRTANPVLSAASIDAMLGAAATATTSLRGPPPGPHGYHGFDGVEKLSGGAFRTFKGGWLPAQGSVVTFTTAGYGYVIAQNGNSPPGVTTEWLAPVSAAAEAHSWSRADLFQGFGMPPLSPTLPPGLGPRAIASARAGERVRLSIASQVADAGRRESPLGERAQERE
jgi:CubicO group peptidase (beta-lactamase class C family)